MFTVRHRYGWKPAEIFVFCITTAIAITLLVLGTTGIFDAKGSIILAVLLIITGWGTTYLAYNRKKNSSVHGQFNADRNFEVSAWIHKPNRAIWGSKMEIGKNKGKLGDHTSISLLTLNTTPVNKVLVFNFRDGKRVYLPYRLADMPQVRDFLLKLVESRNGKVNADSEETMKEIAGLLNQGRKLSKEAPVVDSFAPNAESVEPVATKPAAKVKPVTSTPETKAPVKPAPAKKTPAKVAPVEVKNPAAKTAAAKTPMKKAPAATKAAPASAKAPAKKAAPKK
jgi:hypothetical protein